MNKKTYKQIVCYGEAFFHTMVSCAIILLIGSCQSGGGPKQVENDTLSVPTKEPIAVEEDPVPADIEYIYHLKGMIDGKYDILAELVSDGNKLEGNYKYIKHDNWISLKGTVTGDKIRLEHRLCSHDTSLLVEFFEGHISDVSIKGMWKLVNRDQPLPFVLTPYRGSRLASKHIFITNSVFSSEDSCWHFSEIKVYDNKGGLSQVIDDIDVIVAQNKLFLEDMNEDGYWDLLVMDTTKTSGQSVIQWIYQPASMKYVCDTTKAKPMKGMFGSVEPKREKKKH